jgi:hypothetical protein
VTTRRAVDLFGSAVAAYLAVSALRLSRGTRATVAELTAPAPRPSAGTPPRVVLLLPMLREQTGVRDTCLRFAATVADRPEVEVVLITSRGEADDRDAAVRELLASTAPGRTALDRALLLAVAPGVAAEVRAAVRDRDVDRARALLAAHRRPTTGEAAGPVVAELNAAAGRAAFRHIEVPAEAGTKVGKLNLAVAGIAVDPDGRETYVGVYDADSDPDPRVLDRVAAPTDRRPAVYQQVSCYCRNLSTLAGGRGVLALADALAQTRWALGFEYPLYTRYSRAVRRRRIRPLAYCIGHGCFVSLSFLDRIGGFPTQSSTDDLALGYVASALGAEIAPVPALDYCEVAPDPVQSVRQSRFWFSGSARFWRDLRHAGRVLGARPSAVQSVALHLDGAGRNAAWAGRGPAWLLALLLAAGFRRRELVAALVAAHVLYVQVGYVESLRALRALPSAAVHTDLGRLPRWRVAAGAGAASAVFTLRSLGPFLGAVDGQRRRQGRTWKAER